MFHRSPAEKGCRPEEEPTAFSPSAIRWRESGFLSLFHELNDLVYLLHDEV